MREQNPDPYQNRSQLENAFAFPACRFLHTQGIGRSWNAIYGPCAYPTGKILYIYLYFMTT